MLRELSDSTGRLLSKISEWLWILEDVPEEWKKANITPICKKRLKKDSGNFRRISLISVLGKMMEHILLGAITSQMKHEIGKSQHGFSKGNSCLRDLIALYDKGTCLVDVG